MSGPMKLKVLEKMFDGTDESIEKRRKL